MKFEQLSKGMQVKLNMNVTAAESRALRDFARNNYSYMQREISAAKLAEIVFTVDVVDTSDKSVLLKYNDGRSAWLQASQLVELTVSLTTLESEIKVLEGQLKAKRALRKKMTEVQLSDIKPGAVFEYDDHQTKLIADYRGLFLKAGLGGDMNTLYSDAPQSANTLLTYLRSRGAKVVKS